jgi:uncharacterized protein (TIGR00251 family)
MIADVVVSPGSKRFSISLKDGALRISLRSRPENNKANIELVKGLSAAIGAPVRIVSGLKSKRKKIEIPIDEGRWREFLSGLSPS